MSAKRRQIDDRRVDARARIAAGLEQAIHEERLIVGALIQQPELAAQVDITGDDVLHAAPQLAIEAIIRLRDRGELPETGAIAAIDIELRSRNFEQPDILWLVDCVLLYAGWPTWTPVPLQRQVDRVRAFTEHMREIGEREEIAGRISAGCSLDWAIERLVALRDHGPRTRAA